MPILLELIAQSTPFGPVPTPSPTVIPGAGEDDVSRATLYLIALAVLVAVVALGYFIARDARRSLPRGDREDEEEATAQGGTVDQRERQARNRKQRSKTKAARRARRHNR